MTLLKKLVLSSAVLLLAAAEGHARPRLFGRPARHAGPVVYGTTFAVPPAVQYGPPPMVSPHRPVAQIAHGVGHVVYGVGQVAQGTARVFQAAAVVPAATVVQGVRNYLSPGPTTCGPNGCPNR